MISKRVPMENPDKSNVVKLVDYLSNSQGKQERVEAIRITNCGTQDAVSASKDMALDSALEMLAVQKCNERAQSDKTYHLLISFRSGEEPDSKTLREVEDAFCNALGFSEHQRVSAVHRDTDNLHIHVAINKIHPTRYTIHEPYNDNWTRDQLAADLEKKYNLQPDNHIHQKTHSQTRVADMEAHSGEQSLASWIKQECLADLKAAQTWDDVKAVLADHGLELRQRANGFIFETADGIKVKASTVDRGLSQPALEKRLGVFVKDSQNVSQEAGEPEQRAQEAEQPPKKQTRQKPKKEYKKRPIPVRVDTSKLYARYQVSKANAATVKKEQLQALNNEKQRRIAEARNRANFKRSGLKLGRGRLSKKLAHWQTNKALNDSIAAINADIAAKRKVINQRKPQTWADWLRAQAVAGDAAALEAMRAKDSAAIKKAERQKQPGIDMAAPATGSHAELAPDGVTKTGTVIFKTASGAVRDDGSHISLSKQADDSALVFAMKTAAQRDGSVLRLTGSDTFQEKAARLAGQNGLAVTFRDAKLEKIRKQEHDRQTEQTGRTEQESAGRSGSRSGSLGNDRGNDGGNERHASTAPERDTTSQQRGSSARSGGRDSGRIVVSDPGSFRRIITGDQSKPDIGSIGGFPPPPSNNGMRNLSRLPMAFDTGRGEVLVPPNARAGVDNKRPDTNNAMRWARNRTVTTTIDAPADLAAKKYIHERSEKRLKGFDIPKHTLYSGGAGELVFVGIRRVENHSLALMKKPDAAEVLVLPIDKKTEQRLTQLKRGSQIIVTPEKTILTKTGTRRRGR